MTDTDTVRIIVISTDTTPTDDPDPKRRQHRMDTSVSTAVPLSRLAIDLATKLAADLAEERVPTRWLTNPGSALELAPISGDRWDQTKTLAELDVVDGNRIILTTRDANERYPRIIESLADQSAEIRSSHFAPWDAAASHAFAAAGMPTAVAAVSAIAAGTAVRHGGMAQWIIAAALGIVGVIVALSAVTCTQFKPKSPVTPALGLSMHALLGAAAAAVVPSDGWGVWNLAAAVMITATSAGMVTLQPPLLWGHVAVLTGSGSVLVGAGVCLAYSTWRDVTPVGYASVIATTAFLVYLANVTLARRFARLDLPVLPDVGEDMDMRQTRDLAVMSEKISNSDTWSALTHSEDRNVQARFASLGITVGTGAVAAVCALVAGATVTDATLRFIVPEVDSRWPALLTFTVLAALYILRGTWNTDRGLCTAGVVAGSVVMLSYVAGATLLGRDDSVLRIVGMVLLSLAAVLIASIYLFNATDNPGHEKPVKVVQVFETGLMVLVLMDALVMVNLFFSLRSR
jgi:type VII secretion integral membrane protein EccD